MLCRRAFTLVELLVVITIIGILIALLLPAVQAAREAARRSQCTNNLKQIDLGMHMHHDQKGRLPYGFYWPPSNVGNTGGSEATWIVYLLPYIEQVGLYDRIDWSKGFGSASSAAPNANNYVITSQRIPAFECPSNRAVTPVLTNTYAVGSYVANDGLLSFAESDLRDVPTRSASRSGVFYLMSATRWADFDDGTSNTAMVSEFRVVPNDFRGVMFYPEGPFYEHNYTPNSTVPDVIRTSFCVNEPKSPCQGGFTSYRPRSQIITARSDHPGGVNLALGDGAVRFVGNTIAIEVWKALATPAALVGEALVSQY